MRRSPGYHWVSSGGMICITVHWRWKLLLAEGWVPIKLPGERMFFNVSYIFLSVLAYLLAHIISGRAIKLYLSAEARFRSMYNSSAAILTSIAYVATVDVSEDVPGWQEK